MDSALRDRFDRLLDEVLQSLPDHVLAVFEEVPLIVDDRPDDVLVRKLAQDFDIPDEPAQLDQFASELCGLHSGRMLTERSVEDGADVPPDIRLFRGGIVGMTGGWDQPELTELQVDDLVMEQIRITLLHEVGHHFGLEEEDLEELGYD